MTLSLGVQRSLILAAEHPERAVGLVAIDPSLAIAPGHPCREVYPFDEELDVDEGCAKFNAHYWLRDYAGFVEFFISQCLTEPHSTKPIEDAIGWGLDRRRDPRGALHGPLPRQGCDSRPLLAHPLPGRRHPRRGGRDQPARAGRGAGPSNGRQPRDDRGGGHFPHARDPVEVNLLMRDFACGPPAPRRWVRGKSRRKRALYVSSPIGLGHAQRDAAIADELRKLHPELETTGSPSTP